MLHKVCHFKCSKCTVQWQQVHSHCWATITTIHSQNFLHLVKLELRTHWAVTAHPPRPQPLAATILCSVFMNVTTLSTSYKGNHTVFVLLWLAYSSQHNVFKVHPCCGTCQAEWYSTGCICHILFIRLPMKNLGGFYILTTVNNGAMNICVWISLPDPAFKPSGYIPRRIAASQGNSVSDFLRSHHTAFHRGCTTLRSFRCTSNWQGSQDLKFSPVTSLRSTSLPTPWHFHEAGHEQHFKNWSTLKETLGDDFFIWILAL